MRQNIILFAAILLFATSHDVYAQKRRTEKAYETFAAGEYYNAIDDFKRALSKAKRSDQNTRNELTFIMIIEFYRKGR
jgi:uncharacterized membrane protein